MTTVLVACAAFFLPPAAGLLARQHMPGVWLTAALGAVGVCALLGYLLAFGAAFESVILAVVAVAVSPPHPPSPRKVRQREIRAFRRQLRPLGKTDLEYAEQYDPLPGDKRVA